MLARAKAPHALLTWKLGFLSSLIVLGFLGCSTENQLPATKPPLDTPILSQAHFSSSDAEMPRNCLFIVLDATYAKHVGAWGYERPTTPNLDVLAAEGVRFESAYSQGPSTVPSTWSYMTGRNPVPDSKGGLMKLNADLSPIAENFKQAGFNTFGFSENPYVSEELGYSIGFDEFRQILPLVGPYINRRHEAGERLLDRAFQSIEASKNTPWFTYIHLFRPHNPYLAPDPYGKVFMNEQDSERASLVLELELILRNNAAQPEEKSKSEAGDIDYLVASYDGNLAYVDHLVGKLLKRLFENHDLSNTVVIIASDHGESFSPDRKIGHGDFLFEEFVHVPLMIWAPSITDFSKNVVREPVAMVDIYPTLAEIFSLDPVDALDGTSLLPFLTGGERTQVPFIFSQTLVADKISVRSGDRKLIAHVDFKRREITETQFFDLNSNPNEIRKAYVAIERDETLRQAILNQIASWPVESSSDSNALTQEQIEQLEAVGYVQ